MLYIILSLSLIVFKIRLLTNKDLYYALMNLSCFAKNNIIFIIYFSASHSRKDKLLHFRDITKSLPGPNYDTLKFLLIHLLK